jgi:hypothetical protein
MHFIFFVFSVIAVSSLSTHTFANDVTCSTPTHMSCQKDQQLCIDYFPSEEIDEDQWLEICESAQGKVINSPCLRTSETLTCLNNSNPLLKRFTLTGIPSDQRSLVCESLESVVCN